MALDLTSLKEQLAAAFLEAQAANSIEESTDILSNYIGDAIDAFVKSGTVTAAAGNVRGTCAQLAPFPLVDGLLVDGKIE
jgi:glycerol dehydrogenase-like iron-containing ADH family enzyme